MAAARSAPPAPLGQTAGGEPLTLDLKSLIGSHACVVANSGGGKSGLLRRLLETTHGRVQHLVLDVEDEFYTLRQRFEYVIAGGDGGDVPARPANAGQLARAALEHGFSLVAQLNDLGADGAPEFVGAFLEGLMSAPRNLWRPVLVVIDETQRFSPRLGETAATAGVKDLLARGRKRGFTGVLASQSLPEIDPRVRGLTNNWLLGRAGTSLDRKTVAGELGFAPSSAEARGLASLQREFWAFGPAISPEPVLVRVADVETPMPRPGEARALTPPPAKALARILAGLVPPSAPPAPSPPSVGSAGVPPVNVAALERAAEARGFDRGRDFGRSEGEAAMLERAKAALGGLLIAAAAPDRGRDTAPAAGDVGPAAARDPRPPAPPAPQPPAPAGPSPAAESGLGKGPLALLQALVWWERLRPEPPTSHQVGYMAGYRPGTGTFDKYRSILSSAGLISFPARGRMALTDAGRAAAPTSDAAAEPGALLAAVRASLAGGPLKMLDALAAAYPGDLSSEELGLRSGYQPGTGTFDKHRSTLSGLDLLTYPARGRARAADWLFPKAG